MVVLKRLSRALADGDRVYSVIRGSAVNHDGRTTSLTAPNPLAQEAVLRAAYRDAKIAPSQVGGWVGGRVGEGAGVVWWVDRLISFDCSMM
jgi:acyl transferase domain-containing protein